MKINPHRILLIQIRQIGDVLLTTPLAKILKQHYPKSYIAFLAEKPSYDVISGNPYIDEAIVLNKKERNFFSTIESIRKIRNKNFDLVIDTFGNPRSALITFFSGAKYRMGFDYRGRKHFYNIKAKRSLKPKYAVDFKVDILKAIGVKSQERELYINVPAEAEEYIQNFLNSASITKDDFLISISPVSRRSYKIWPKERFAQLSDLLISRYKAKVIFVWGPGERKYIEEIASIMQYKPIISCETRSLKELAALLKRCHLHIGNDNATKHIAVAIKTPTITIFGPSSNISWNPPDNMHKAIKKETHCINCDRHTCENLKCFDLITVDDVEEVFKEIYPKIRNL